MIIRFSCLHCGQDLQVSESFAEPTIECATCKKQVTVPRMKSLMTGAKAPVATRRRSGGNSWLLAIGGVVIVAAVLAVAIPLVLYLQNRSQFATSRENLRRIWQAMHNYHELFGHFPAPYATNRRKQPVLSWRVTLLRHLDRGDLKQKVHEGESWNSAANAELTGATVKEFIGPWRPYASSLETGYMVITGPGTLFEEGVYRKIVDCTDGTANTILVVEVKKSGVVWSEPKDLDIRTMVMQINASDDNGISGPWRGGANVVMADGTVRFLPKDLLDKRLRAMITRNGRENVNVIGKS